MSLWSYFQEFNNTTFIDLSELINDLSNFLFSFKIYSRGALSPY